MKLEAKDTLVLEGIIQGDPAQGQTMFMLCFVDCEGNKKFSVIGCKPNHVEGLMKTLKRVISVRVPGFPDLPKTKIPEQLNLEVHERLTEEQTKERYKGLIDEEETATKKETRHSDTSLQIRSRDHGTINEE